MSSLANITLLAKTKTIVLTIIHSVYNLVTPKLPQNYLLKNHFDLVKNTQDLDDGVLPHIDMQTEVQILFQIH